MGSLVKLWRREDRERFINLLKEEKEGSLKEALIMYVEGYRNVTFVEFEKEFEPFHSIKGDMSFGLPGHINVILYTGVSEEFITAIEDLLNEKRISIEPCSELLYLLYGKIITYPMPIPPLEKEYNERVWIPTVVVVKEEIDDTKISAVVDIITAE